MQAPPRSDAQKALNWGGASGPPHRKREHGFWKFRLLETVQALKTKSWVALFLAEQQPQPALDTEPSVDKQSGLKTKRPGTRFP